MQLTDEQCIEAVEIWRRHGCNKEAAAKDLGIPRSTLFHRLQRAAERGLDGSIPKPLPPGQIIRGVSTLYDSDGNEKLTWVKTKQEVTTQIVIEALREVFEEYKGYAPLIPCPESTRDDILTVYPIADQHLGLLSWGKETGEDWDLELACKTLHESVANLAYQSLPSKQAVILNLGDWTHQDSNKNQTPRSGHTLDVDGRYFKVVKAGVRLMKSIIELAAQKHETVIVRNLPGNHDPHASVALTLALSAYFHDNPRIEISEDPGEWFFHRFGANLIGAHHGDKAKPQEMMATLACRNREEWGNSKYCWILHGHHHRERLTEIGDVRIEGFRSLAGRDSFAAGHGYCSGHSLVSVTLHRERGEIGRHRVNL